MVNKLEFEIAMIRANVNQKQVAKNLGISRMALYEKLNGRRSFKLSEVNQLCKMLNLGKEEREKIFFGKMH